MLTNFFVTLQAVLTNRVERDDKGATAVEYGLMVALIAIVIIAAVTTVGENLAAIFGDVATALELGA